MIGHAALIISVPARFSLKTEPGHASEESSVGRSLSWESGHYKPNWRAVAHLGQVLADDVDSVRPAIPHEQLLGGRRCRVRQHEALVVQEVAAVARAAPRHCIEASRGQVVSWVIARGRMQL